MKVNHNKCHLLSSAQDERNIQIANTAIKCSKSKKLHERCLRIIYNDKHSNFEELLVKDNSVFMHHNNIHTLAIEMYKAANGISPKIMNDIFKLRENTHHNLRHTSQFLVDPIYSVFNGSESALYLRAKIWEQIPF